MASAIIQCHVVEHGDATYYCVQCDRTLCASRCYGAHAIPPANAKHEVQLLEGVDPEEM